MVRDYDNFNVAWSGEDTVTVAFDRSTDHGRALRSGNREYVDRLFAFDHWLGNDYSGEWSDTSIFVITAVDTQLVRPSVDYSTVSSSRRILNAAATATCCGGHVSLTGTFGADATGVPRLVSYTASDPLVEGAGPSSGDRATIKFNMATDLGGGRPLSDFLTFHPPLPVDAAIRVINLMTIEVIVGPSGGGADGNAFLVGASKVSLTGGVIRSARVAAAALSARSADDTYAPSADVTLSGSFGTSQPPQLIEFVPYDPENADLLFGDGDQFMLRFDVYTDQSGELPSKEAVDEVLSFSSSLGQDYSAAWSECYDQETQSQCRTLTITVVDALISRDESSPVLGRTLAWVNLPAADASALATTYAGIRTGSGNSAPSTTVIALGASELTEGEPMHPMLDIGRKQILFLQRSPQNEGTLLEVSPEVAYERSRASSLAATAAAASSARVVNDAGLEGDGYRIWPYGGAPALAVRQCSLRVRAVPQHQALIGGLTVRTGSCNRSDAQPPAHIMSAYLAGGGCAAAGVGCGVSIMLSTLRVELIRPPGAPIAGGTTVHILGHDLSSVRYCQFLAPNASLDSGLSLTVPTDASGFSCTVPALNTSMFAGYDKGAASQRITIRLSEDAQHFFAAQLEFVYFRQPIVSGAHPLNGPSTGGFTVIRGAGLSAVLGDASAARCLIGGLRAAVSEISPSGEELTCMLPPLPSDFALGTEYSLSVAIDGQTFISDASLGRYSYYLPPVNGSLQPVTGFSEEAVEVTIYAAGLQVQHAPPGYRCQFGVAGTSPAHLVTVPSSDPLRPELSHIELRCHTPPCMQWGCIGTVEVTVALNGMDYTSFDPPLLYRYHNEFILHAWGCERSNNSIGSSSDGGSSTSATASATSLDCGTAVVQRAMSTSDAQLQLSMRSERLATELEGWARPRRENAAALLATREADRASTSWELQQAHRDLNLAVANELAVSERLNSTLEQLASWDASATVARVPIAARDLLAIDALDKRIYWVHEGTLWRAHYQPGAILGPRQRLLAVSPTMAGLLLCRPSAQLYWTAQSETDGSSYEVRRVHLTGAGEEVLLASMPPQTRAYDAALSSDGLLSVVYVGVSQPGNASLLLVMDVKDSSSASAWANRSIITLLRDIAPTALAQHGTHFYFSVAVTQSIRRCNLDGSDCVNLHSTALAHGSAEPHQLPQQRSYPTGLSLDPVGVHGLAWADPLANRVFMSATNGSGAVALWLPSYVPQAVELSTEGPLEIDHTPTPPVLLAVSPIGGPVVGNTSITVHGLSLGNVKELRYLQENEWASDDSAGLGLAFLPLCHADCPQTMADVTYLEEPWRGTQVSVDDSLDSFQVASASSSAGVGARSVAGALDATCDNLAPHALVDDGGLDGWRWVQFRGRAGQRMRMSSPAGSRCGTEAAGWLNSSLPRAGEKPMPATVCFAYGWSDCLWSTEVRTCACSYDGGASTIYSYRLRNPPGAPTCVSYCAEGRSEIGDAHNGSQADAAEWETVDAQRDHLINNPLGAAEAEQLLTTRPFDPTYGVQTNASRVAVVGYMPGDPRDDGAHLDFASESRVFGRTPPLPAQRVQLQVSVGSGSGWQGGMSPVYGLQSYMALKYSFYDEPHLSQLWPTAGPISGGTNITVSGSGFDVLPGLDGVVCRFGSQMTAAYFKNGSHVLCATPRESASSEPGLQPFALTLNGQDYHRAPGVLHAAGSFTFYQPQLNAIEPTCGSTRGGIYVTIYGVGFDALGGIAVDAANQLYEPRCRFNALGQEAAGSIIGEDSSHHILSAIRVTATSVICLVPGMSHAGRSAVALALNGIDFDGEIPFEYVNDPIVRHVEPSGGPVSGGTLITLVGNDFRSLEQEDAYLEQWATSASARSEYSDSVGAASRATGEPDATSCGDNRADPKSWRPALGTNVPDWLQVTYARPVRPWRWRIIMSSRPHSVVKVELVDTLGKRLAADFNASAQKHSECACAGGAVDRCNGYIEGFLAWRELPHIVGLRISTISDGWEGIDAVQLAGYAETQQCKFGHRYSSMLEQQPGRVVCTTPSYATTALSVRATSRLGATAGLFGYFYPLYLVPPAVPHHAHIFDEYPGVRFYMPDRESHHALFNVAPEDVAGLLPYMPNATGASSTLSSVPTNTSDTCEWAGDGICDGSPFCDHGTDCTDCGQCFARTYVVPVEISLNGRDGQPLSLGSATGGTGGIPVFTFYPLPVLQPPWPDATLAYGGTMVTIYGQGLAAFGDLQTTKCQFGETVVAALHKDASRVVCETPPVLQAMPAREGNAALQMNAVEGSSQVHPADSDHPTGDFGVVDVWLTLNNQDYQHVGEVQYFFIDLHAVRPSGGPSGGGSLLTVSGNGFADVHPLSFAKSPLRSARCRFAFHVPLDGETRVAGQGAARYLAGGSDGLAAPWTLPWHANTPVLSRSAHEVRCVTPSAPAGFVGYVQVSLTFNGVDFLPQNATQAPRFYMYALHLESLTPRGGPALGGTTILISGASLAAFGHLEDTLCRFGDSPGLIVRANARDNTTIACTTPNSCNPLDSTSIICDAGHRFISPTQRNFVVIEGKSLQLDVPAANATSWTPTEVFVSLNGQDFSAASVDVDPLTFHYYPLPTLLEVQPTGGPVDSPTETSVTVRGSGFSALNDALTAARISEPTAAGSVWCRFGTTSTAREVAARWHNDTFVECPFPTGHGAGDILVQISLNGIDWYGALEDAGESALDFQKGADHATSATSASGEGRERMTDTAREAGGEYSSGRRRGQLSSAPLRYTLFEQPTLRAINPTVGHTAGGIRVTITGARFNVYGGLWQARCRFGADVTPAISKTHDEIVCTLPPTSRPRASDQHATLHPVRTREYVSVSIDEGVSWTRHDLHNPIEVERYDAAVTSITPTAGPVLGGYPVRVHGRGLLAIPLPDNLDPRLPNGASASSSILSASAARGPYALPDDALCAFGADVRAASRRTGAWIECIAPPAYGQLQAGQQERSVRLRVSLRGSDFLPELDDASGLAPPLYFRYFAQPAVHTIRPEAGPSVGGTQVTISGKFPVGLPLADLRCRVGERPVAILSLTSDEARCEVPPHMPPGGATSARAHVALSFNGGAHYTEGFLPLLFRYYVQELVSVSPLGGPTAGGTVLTFFGAGFELGGNASNVRANLTWEHRLNAGGLVLPSIHLGAADAVGLGSVSFRTTPTAQKGMVAATITLNADDNFSGDYLGSTADPVTFRFYAPPVVSSLSPAIGPIRGGTLLTMRGAGFDAFGEVPSRPTIDVTSTTVLGGSYEGYVVDGVLNKDIVLLRGVSYRFRVDARSHPLILSTKKGSRKLDGELTERDGVVNSRIEQGTLIFTPGARTPATLFYQDMAAPVTAAAPLLAGRSQRIKLLSPTGACSLRVGGARLTPIARNKSTLELRMPAAAGRGWSGVDISLNGEQFEAPSTFYYHALPHVSALQPSSGPSAGGTRLRLAGVDLTLPTAVREAIGEGNTPLPAFVLNGALVPVSSFADDGSALNLTLPSLPTGTHVLSLTLTGRVRDGLATGASVLIYQPIDLSGGVQTSVVGQAAANPGLSSLAGSDEATPSVSPSASIGSTIGSIPASNSAAVGDDAPTALISPAGGPVLGGTRVTILTPTLPQGLVACCTFGDPQTSSCVDAQILPGFTPTSDRVRCDAPPSGVLGSVFLGISLNGGSDIDAVGTYLYTQISLTSLAPMSAPAKGGTLLTISGVNLQAVGIPPAVARCRVTYEAPLPSGSAFDSLPLIALRNDAAECSAIPTCGCTDPSAGCTLTVQLMRNGVDVDGTFALPCYIPLTLEALTPSAGPTGGGTVITVTGGPFTSSGGAPTPAHIWFGESKFIAQAGELAVVITAPAVSAAAYADSSTQPLRVSLNAQDYSPSLEEAPRFTYYETPYVQRIRPTAGPVSGGTAITLSGLRLNANGWATLGRLATRLGRDVSATQTLNAVALDRARGSWIHTNLTTRAAADCTAQCCAIANDGVTTVACDAPVPSEATASAACAACSAPIGVALNGLNYDWPSPAVPFTFYDAAGLTLASASPRSGPQNGGTSITLHGSGLTPAGAFAEDARCAFGRSGIGAPSQSVPVLRADPDGKWIVCSPTSPFDIAALATEGQPSPFNATVSIAPNGVNFEQGSVPLIFYVYTEPAPASMLPNGGPTSGGTTVLVVGTGLGPGPHTDALLARCRFGRREAGAVVNVSTVDELGVRCHPNPPTDEYVIGVDKGLQVALNGQQFSPIPSGLPYRYYIQPQLSSIWPTGGPAAGGSPVTLNGFGFDRFEGVARADLGDASVEGDGQPLCIFGGLCYDADRVHRGLRCALPPRVTDPQSPLAAVATMQSRGVVLCRAPPVDPLPILSSRDRTSVRVAVALNAQNFVHERTPLFVYYSGVTAISIHPQRGPPRGGVEVRVAGTHLNVFGETRDARCRFSGWMPLIPSAASGMEEAANAVVDVTPTFKGEDHMVCRTPAFPAGTTTVQISLNGRDFHGASPPLKHRFACEQHDSLNVARCIGDHSCGHCHDELPVFPLDHSEYGITQDRIGCTVCHADGCAAGPAVGTCRRWTFEARMLMPSADVVQARALIEANVSEPLDGNERATATGWLLPGQMRYFRIRPPRASIRILVSAANAQGRLTLVAGQRLAPRVEPGGFELGSTRAGTPQVLTIPAERIHCRDAANTGSSGTAHATTPHCEEWVIGVLGEAWVSKDLGDLSPQHRLTDFALTVRIELHAEGFSCAECAHDCTQCGWTSGHSTQFLRDLDGRPVARLTNDTHQLGTLWASQPQPYTEGFEASFSFRISEPSVCTVPLEMYGANVTAAAVQTEADFIPFDDLKAAGDEMTHYLIDDPSLPFEQLPPPQGVPLQLADEVGIPADPTVRYGVLSMLRSGQVRAPFLGRELRCPTDAERIGGEGFAFVLQSSGLDAAGCAGSGLGYAAAPNCTRGGIDRSLAIQFDTHHNARTVRSETCIDYDSKAKRCRPGALKVVESVRFDRQHAVSVFVGGVNGKETELLSYLLERIRPTRLDDGQVHSVRVLYQPPPSGASSGGVQGRLELTFDGSREVVFSLPITLPHVHEGEQHPGIVSSVGDGVSGLDPASAVGSPGRAYVGFTASTGEASELHDIISASYCHKLGCSEL